MKRQVLILVAVLIVLTSCSNLDKEVQNSITESSASSNVEKIENIQNDAAEEVKATESVMDTIVDHLDVLENINEEFYVRFEVPEEIIHSEDELFIIDNETKIGKALFKGSYNPLNRVTVDIFVWKFKDDREVNIYDVYNEEKSFYEGNSLYGDSSVKMKVHKDFGKYIELIKDGGRYYDTTLTFLVSNYFIQFVYTEEHGRTEVVKNKMDEFIHSLEGYRFGKKISLVDVPKNVNDDIATLENIKNRSIPYEINSSDFVTVISADKGELYYNSEEDVFNTDLFSLYYSDIASYLSHPVRIFRGMFNYGVEYDISTFYVAFEEMIKSNLDVPEYIDEVELYIELDHKNGEHIIARYPVRFVAENGRVFHSYVYDKVYVRGDLLLLMSGSEIGWDTNLTLKTFEKVNEVFKIAD